MNLPVSKTTNPTKEEWKLINEKKMRRRIPKADWENELSMNRLANATVKAVRHVAR